MLWLLFCAAACFSVQGYTPDDVAAPRLDSKEPHHRLLREDRRAQDDADGADQVHDHEGSVAALVGSDGRMNFNILSREDDASALTDVEEKVHSPQMESFAPRRDLYAENICPWWFNPPITTYGEQSAMRRCYNNEFCTGDSCCVSQQSNTYLCPQKTGYMCAAMDVCGDTNETANMCDYACVATPDACSTHGDLRLCEGPPGPTGPSANVSGVAGPPGPQGSTGKDNTNDGMPISPGTAGILIFAFVVNIIIAAAVFHQHAKRHGWKRPGFGDPKPGEEQQEEHEYFQEHEPGNHDKH